MVKIAKKFNILLYPRIRVFERRASSYYRPEGEPKIVKTVIADSHQSALMQAYEWAKLNNIRRARVRVKKVKKYGEKDGYLLLNKKDSYISLVTNI